jgi:hypothetical protein
MMMAASPNRNKARAINALLAITVLIVMLTHYGVLVHGFQLTTSSTTIPKITREEMHSFLANPKHWPQIVLSSHSVKTPAFATNPVDVPMNVGDYVEEVFGLPPLLPLSVIWKCVKSDPNVDDGTCGLEFYSENGVPRLAKNCKMKFIISEESLSLGSSGPNEMGCQVDLLMEFEPRNPLITAGIPFLNADNNIALKVLLPKAIRKRTKQR